MDQVKKIGVLLLPPLLAILLIACGQTALPEEVPPAENTALEADPPEEAEDLPEGAVALTAEEIAQVNEAFTPTFERDNMLYANPLDSFFTCYYRTPEEIDLSVFLEYWFPPPEEERDARDAVSQEEYKALTELADWPFERDRAREDMPVPIHWFPKDRVDRFLTEYAGVTTADLTAPWTSGLFYLEAFRTYYNTTSDFGPGVFQCESGWYTDEEARLTGGRSVLTLENREGKWLIQSFLPEEAVPLTEEEIAQVNAAFVPELERDGLSVVNPLTCFVSCYYRWREELDLAAFLRHFWPQEEISGEAEFEALKAAEGWPFGDTAREEMLVPIHKYLRTDVDACLKEHMGVTTEYLGGGPGAKAHSKGETLCYLPEYEAYYNFVSDMDQGCFQCTSGWYSEDTARLWSADSVLTLRNQDGSWYFQSFLPLRAES